MLHHWLATLNECAGFFVLLCFLMLYTIAHRLATVLRQLECLHEDYDRTTQAHERDHFEIMARAEREI